MPLTLRLLATCSLRRSGQEWAHLEMEAVLGCPGGPRSRRGASRLGISFPIVHEPCFLDLALLSSVRDQKELAALPFPPSYQQTFGGVGLRKLMAGGFLQLPPVKVRRWYLLQCG